MTWTNVAKPTSTTYTNVNPQGVQMYDDPGLTYDSSSNFYDSVNMGFWTIVPKPVPPLITKVGLATGLITPPTYSSVEEDDIWTRVKKPT